MLDERISNFVDRDSRPTCQHQHLSLVQSHKSQNVVGNFNSWIHVYFIGINDVRHTLILYRDIDTEINQQRWRQHRSTATTGLYRSILVCSKPTTGCIYVCCCKGDLRHFCGVPIIGIVDCLDNQSPPHAVYAVMIGISRRCLSSRCALRYLLISVRRDDERNCCCCC